MYPVTSVLPTKSKKESWRICYFVFGFVLVKPKTPLSFTLKEIQIWWQGIHNSVGLRAVWESKRIRVLAMASLDWLVAFRNAQVTFVTQSSFLNASWRDLIKGTSNLDSVFDFSARLLSLLGIVGGKGAQAPYRPWA